MTPKRLRKISAAPNFRKGQIHTVQSKVAQLQLDVDLENI